MPRNYIAVAVDEHDTVPIIVDKSDHVAIDMFEVKLTSLEKMMMDRKAYNQVLHMCLIAIKLLPSPILFFAMMILSECLSSLLIVALKLESMWLVMSIPVVMAVFGYMRDGYFSNNSKTIFVSFIRLALEYFDSLILKDKRIEPMMHFKAMLYRTSHSVTSIIEWGFSTIINLIISVVTSCMVLALGGNSVFILCGASVYGLFYYFRIRPLQETLGEKKKHMRERRMIIESSTKWTFNLLQWRKRAVSEAMSPEKVKEGFTFHDVSFKYPGSDRYAIRNLSFHLPAGKKLALVGENGAGKTTLVKLLARLYEPDSGYITVDGIDLRNIELHSLRDNIGIIFQDYVRFNLSAAENIAIGDILEKENEQKIVEAAEKSLADPMIRQLPLQYRQMLGKRFQDGTELSGGQWQKIALARAYLRDAQLLILDEPTASLDARAEKEVFDRFAELISGKTAVLISHRFSTVRMADLILFLENGQLLEMGSHHALLEAQGKYAELFHLQAKGYQD